MLESPYWLQFIQPFGTLLLGVTAGAIALRQWMTAHEKLRLDLFPLRAAVFENTAAVMRRIIDTREASDDDWQEFLRASYRTSMLFGQDANDLIGDVRQHVSAIRTFSGLLNANEPWSSNYTKDEAFQRHQDAWMAIGNSFPEMHRVFGKYLHFETASLNLKQIMGKAKN